MENEGAPSTRRYEVLFDEEVLGLRFRQQRNGRFVVENVQGQASTKGISVGDAITHIGGTELSGKTQHAEVVRTIASSSRPLLVVFSAPSVARCTPLTHAVYHALHHVHERRYLS
jgi:hypothetical protein